MLFFIMLQHLVAEISRFKFDDYGVIRTGASDLKLFWTVYVHRWIMPTLVWIMIYRLIVTKPLPNSMLANYQSDLQTNFSEIWSEIPMVFFSTKCVWKLRQWNGSQIAFLSLCFYASSLTLGNSCSVIQCYNRVIIKAIIRLWKCRIFQWPSP